MGRLFLCRSLILSTIILNDIAIYILLCGWIKMVYKQDNYTIVSYNFHPVVCMMLVEQKKASK